MREELYCHQCKLNFFDETSELDIPCLHCGSEFTERLEPRSNFIFDEASFQAALNRLFHQHQQGSLSPGLSQGELDQLPQKKLTSSTPGIGGECSICQDLFTEGDHVTELVCSHTFHLNCIKPWLSRTASCPTCRNHPLNR